MSDRFPRSSRAMLSVCGLLILAGCGKVQNLRPAPGKTLAQKPATAPSQPTPQNLLTVPTQSRPGRSDELLSRSAERPDDKFDLPPH